MRVIISSRCSDPMMSSKIVWRRWCCRQELWLLMILLSFCLFSWRRFVSVNVCSFRRSTKKKVSIYIFDKNVIIYDQNIEVDKVSLWIYNQTYLYGIPFEAGIVFNPCSNPSYRFNRTGLIVKPVEMKTYKIIFNHRFQIYITVFSSPCFYQ